VPLRLFCSTSVSLVGGALKNRKSEVIPPDEPPHDSSWLTGLSVWPIRLLIVSPHYRASGLATMRCALELYHKSLWQARLH